MIEISYFWGFVSMFHNIWKTINKLMSSGHGWICYIFFGVLALSSYLYYNSSFIDKNIPVILTMKDLGYENSVTESVDYRTYSKNINLYRLRIANTSDLSDEHYQFLNITLVEAMDGNQAYSMLQEEMLSVKKAEQEWISDCKSGCFAIDNLKSIDVDQDFFRLEPDVWNAEQAYALYDDQNYPENKYYLNYVFLLKENRALILEFKTSFPMTSEKIEVMGKDVPSARP